MILDDLVNVTKKRINVQKEVLPLSEVKELASKQPDKDPQQIINTFLSPGLHIIGEVKKASPSKGQIVSDFPYTQIAQDYQNAGVSAISVLTEPDYFQGKLEYLKQISQTASTPLLRKDFTIDPYMIYQAKASGASLILLIVAILTDEQLNEYLALAKQLNLLALIEVHNENELKRALKAKAQMIGVNNRNLKDFTVNINNSLKLRQYVPDDIPFITESGIKTIEDIQQIKAANVNGVLIGETLMRADDKKKIIQQFQKA